MEAAYSFYKRGMELLETGNPAQAAILLEKAKTLEPGKVSIMEALGRAYFNYGQYISALKNFKESIEKQPTDDFLHFCLAFTYHKLRKKTFASKHIKLALALEPGSENYQKLFVRIKN